MTRRGALPDPADPATWPLYPVLPLVRRTTRSFPELGFVVAGGGPVVYRGDALHAFDVGPSVDLSRFPSTEYETIEALLEDGWEVD